jgi:MoxR-like ATPase
MFAARCFLMREASPLPGACILFCASATGAGSFLHSVFSLEGVSFSLFATICGSGYLSEAPMSSNAPSHAVLSASFSDAIRERVARAVVGQDTVVERMLIALLTGGHLLLMGVPGLAKTLLVQAVSRSIHLQFSRVQFTIDMLPSDILGSEVLDPASGKFQTHKGPVFTNLLLADEINRAAPKVQSALLEAMQERRVTIGNATYPLPTPFLVIATQNPVEQAGTFELPEAQLDRFMLCHRLQYPAPSEEEEIVRRQLAMGIRRADKGAVPKSAFDQITSDAVCGSEDLIASMEAVQRVHVSDVFVKHCVNLITATRSCPEVELGCSPRASLALVQAARARAFLHNREYVTPDDLFALAEDVILHRIRLRYEALASGRSPRAVLRDLLRTLA